MRDRLIELLDEADKMHDIKQCEGCAFIGHGDKCVKHFVADYLLSNGVIVLHCKVGDKVYQINTTPYGGDVYELKIFDIVLRKNKPYYETDTIDFDVSAIGKSIFLTKEKAGKALSERKWKK